MLSVSHFAIQKPKYVEPQTLNLSYYHFMFKDAVRMNAGDFSGVVNLLELSADIFVIDISRPVKCYRNNQ